MQQPKQQCPSCMKYCGINDLVCSGCLEELPKRPADSTPTEQIHSAPINQNDYSPFSSGVVDENDNSRSEQDSIEVESREQAEVGGALSTADDHATNNPYQSASSVDSMLSQWSFFNAGEIVVGLVWIVVCVSGLFFMPGLGIGLLTLSLPPLVRTALVVARRRPGGKEFTLTQKVGLLVGSTVLTMLAIVTVGVCVIAGLFAGCFAGLPLGANAAPVIGMVFGGIGGLVLGTWVCLIVVRARWKSDMSR